MRLVNVFCAVSFNKRKTIPFEGFDAIFSYDFCKLVIILEPRELAVPESISARTLADMDRAVSNFKKGDVSPIIDLSDF